MRLTNDIRDRFVASVMADTPAVDYQGMAQDMVEKWLSCELDKVFPELDWGSPDRKKWLHACSVRMPGCLRAFYTNIPGYDYVSEAAPQLWGELVKISDKLAAQTATHAKLKAAISKVAYGATTTKALAELLPEFSKYIPAERAPSKLLPATTGVVDAFKAAGWPK